MEARGPSMRFDVITLFPEIFDSWMQGSLLGKACARGDIAVRIHDLRAFGVGPHQETDDAPFGGGPGMIMKPEPIHDALTALRDADARDELHVILTTPQGTRLTQEHVQRLCAHPRIAIVCGRYGGVDARVAAHMVDEEISIGDYILGGGEVAAMVLVEAVSRLVPGVVGNTDSVASDSFPGLLQAPAYTRPAEFQGMAVPEVLLSGHHSEIASWRRRESLRRTWERRPELLETMKDSLSAEERAWVARWKAGGGD